MTHHSGNHTDIERAQRSGPPTSPTGGASAVWMARLLVLLGLLVAGCGTDDTKPGYDDADGDDSSADGGVVEPCDDGGERACGVTIDQANGVVTCFHGRQYCEGGVWSECTDGEITREPDSSNARLQDMRRALALSTPIKCINNPCDPQCWTYIEDPNPNYSGGGTPATGRPNYPGNPSSCGHDLCSTGAALSNTCNTCAASVCAANPACCTTGWSQACVDLVYTTCALERPPLKLCDFGLYSDSTINLSNSGSTQAVLGAYGDITLSTDTPFAGVISTGNISLANLNGTTVNAPYGIVANGSVTFAAGTGQVNGNVTAGGAISIANVKLNGVVTSGSNITGQAGNQIYGNTFANGTIDPLVYVSPGTKTANAGVTILPVTLPPQESGRSVPVLFVDCSGTNNFFTNGTNANIPGPGTYGDVDITNNGSLTLQGQGTYFFKSLQVSNRIILDPGAQPLGIGWDIRVCNTVSLRDNTKIQGSWVGANDSNNVLLNPKYLTLYANTSSDVYMGNDVYWTGVMMAPNATINKGNVNSAPPAADVIAGTRAAPVNGALWGKRLQLGTNALTKSIAKVDCESLPVAEFFPERVCPVPNDGTPPAINQPCGSGLDCQINTRCVNPKTEAACAHSKCMTGAKLSPKCDDCVDRICDVEPSCCNVAWTQSCVDRVATTCDAICGLPSCQSNACSVGPAIPASCASTGNCVANVCASMPSCCTTAWTSDCVNKAYALCGTGTNVYPPGTSVCDYAVYGNGAVALAGGSGAGEVVTVNGGKVGGLGVGSVSVQYGTVNDDVYSSAALNVQFSTINGAALLTTAGTGNVQFSTISSNNNQIIEGYTLPAAPRPTRSPACPATSGVTSTGGSLSPADVIDVVAVPDGATLTLAAGTYTFNSLRLGDADGDGTGAILQLPATGHVTINVCGPVTFTPYSAVAGLTPSTALNLDVFATGAITFAGHNTAYGFYNSNTDVSVLDHSTLYGLAISGSSASVKTGSTVDASGLGDDCRGLGLDPASTTLTPTDRLCAYGLYAGGKYWPSNGTTVYGDIGAGTGGINFVGGSNFHGTALSQGLIEVNGVTTVRGDVRTKDIISNANDLKVFGAKVTGDTSIIAPSFPTVPFVCPTGGPGGGSGSYSPDTYYGDVAAYWGGSITLTAAGNYYFSSLTVQDAAFNLPATGNVNIYVCNSVSIVANNGSPFAMTGIGTTAAEAMRLRIYSNSSSSSDAISLDMQGTVPFRGVLMAPTGIIRLSNSTRLIGVSWGQSTYMASNSELDSRGITGAACVAAGLDNLPTCPTTITPVAPPSSGICNDNALGYTDAKCAGYDLALGTPCDNQVPVCNHGTAAFSGNVQVSYWDNALRQMSVMAPAATPTGTCSAALSIAAGACANVTCSLPSGLTTLMVDPNDALAECSDHRMDNWSVSDGRSCSGGATFVREENYEAKNCPEGTSGRWGLLTWDATTPTGAKVTFAGRTATTEAGLASAGAYKPLGVAQLSPDTQKCTLSGPSPCPIDLTAALSLGTSQPQWLGVKITIESTGSVATLNDWNITYSCVYDQ
ncbi:MAG TPA: hypothetical protein VLC09_11900 [Polyangiaceae bacterium]|nr:hypothetical protein [Polyangiaceae bacterium]